MFGNNMNQQPQTSGLFGQSSGGLFGGGQTTNPQTQQTQQGSIWGTGTSTTLGGQMQMGQPTSGIFGQPQSIIAPQQTTGQSSLNLFGQQPKQAPSLFAPTTSSNIGQTPQQQQGIFGGGMYGQTPGQGQNIQQPVQTGLGIFNQPQQGQSTWNMAQPTQTGISLGGVSTTPQLGNNLSFGQQGQNIFATTQNSQIGQPTSQMGGVGGFKLGTSTTTTGTGVFPSLPTSGGLFNNQMNPPQNQQQNIFGMQQQGQTGLNLTAPGQGIQGQQLGMQTGLGSLSSAIFGNTNQQKSTGIFATGLGTTPSGPTTGVLVGNIQQPIQQSNVTTGSYPFAYQVSKIPESTTVGNQQKVENVNLVSITGMPNYNMKSIEELRYEDYINKKQGLVAPKLNSSQTGGGFPSTGQIVGINQIGAVQSGQKTGMFQQTQQTSNIGNLFGQKPIQNVQGTSLFQTAQPQNTNLQQGTLGVQQQGQSMGLNQMQNQFGTGLSGQFSLGQQPALNQTNLTGVQTTPSLFSNPQPNVQGMMQQQQTGQTQQGGFFTSMGGTKTQGSLFGNTNMTQPITSQITGQKPAEGGLFQQNQPQTAQTQGVLFSNVNPQQTTSLFGQVGSQPATSTNILSNKPQTGSLFSTNPQSTGLFTQSTAPQGNKPQEGLFSQPQTSTNLAAPLGIIPFFPAQTVDYNSFIRNSLEKQKTITDMLNELQKEYIVQDFFLNDLKTKKERQEGNYPEGKYSYIPITKKDYFDYDYKRYKPKERGQDYDLFLKSKRPHEPKLDSFSIYHNQKKEEPISKSSILGEDTRIKKSHSADSFKTHEKQIFNRVDREFNEINLGEKYDRRVRKIEELTFSLTEPREFIFKLMHIDPNAVLKEIKQDILNKLKKEFKDLFINFTTYDFILLRNYRTLKDSLTVSENNIKNHDFIYIILKKQIDQNDDESLYSSRKTSNISDKKLSFSTRKESKIEKPEKTKSNKKKNKSNIAPLEMLPTLTKAGYQTSPSMKEICRMTLEELRNIENFTIWNEHGKIEFKESTDLTKLNLDQIVVIQPMMISVYQNGSLDFKPEKGQGLNKPAILHMYNVFPKKPQENGDKEEEKHLFLMSLQKLCKDKKVIYF